MAEVVLDANVIVGWLDKADVHNARATELIDGLKRDGHVALLFDVFVAEAVSVICRRAQERRSKSTDLSMATSVVRRWHEAGQIAPVSGDVGRRFGAIMDVVEASAGALNFNDALLVVLQREGAIGGRGFVRQGARYGRRLSSPRLIFAVSRRPLDASSPPRPPSRLPATTCPSCPAPAASLPPDTPSTTWGRSRTSRPATSRSSVSTGR